MQSWADRSKHGTPCIPRHSDWRAKPPRTAQQHLLWALWGALAAPRPLAQL